MYIIEKDENKEKEAGILIKIIFSELESSHYFYKLSNALAHACQLPILHYSTGLGSKLKFDT